MEAIIDHKKDGNAVKDADRYFYNRGRQYPKKTTAGWKLCVQWKGGLTSWETLADLKESYPVQVAEYAKAVGIDSEPAFCLVVTPRAKEKRPHYWESYQTVC